VCHVTDRVSYWFVFTVPYHVIFVVSGLFPHYIATLVSSVQQSIVCLNAYNNCDYYLLIWVGYGPGLQLLTFWGEI